MDIARSDIVKATAGRDAGKLFFVLGVEGDFLLLADGKTRRLEKPKRKKRRHVVFQAEPQGEIFRRFAEAMGQMRDVGRQTAVMAENGLNQNT